MVEFPKNEVRTQSGPRADPVRTQQNAWWVSGRRRVIICSISGVVGRGVFGDDFRTVSGMVFGVVFGVVLGWVSAVDFGRVCVALPHCQKRRGGAGSGAGPAGRLVVFFLDFFGGL